MLPRGGQRGGGPMDDILIEELELGVRSYNCLKRAGIQTVGDLVSKSEGELAAIPNFGKKSIDEVIETLSQRGPDAAHRLRPMRHQKTRHKLSPRRRAPQGAARQPLHRGHRPRADQDHRGQGQGGQAGDREADHAGAQGRPARAPAGDLDPPASRQGRDLQALRGDRAALHGAPGRLHADPEARPALAVTRPRWSTSSWSEASSPRLSPIVDRARSSLWSTTAARSRAGPNSPAGGPWPPKSLRRCRRSCGTPVDLTVAGRTDRGVHALGQVISYDGPLPNLRSVNAVLPREIVVLRAEEAPDGFSARHDATSRTYRYRVLARRAPSPFERGRALWWPHRDRPGRAARLRRRAGRHPRLHRLHADRDLPPALRARRPPRGWRRDGDVLDLRDRGRLVHAQHEPRPRRHDARGRRQGRRDDFAAPARGRPARAAGDTAPAHGLYLAAVSY